MPSQPAPRRVLPWEGCLNARDLGGYPTRDGRETRWRSLVRSDGPNYLNEAGRESLVAYGIRTIVDLRLPNEVEQFPYPFYHPGSHGVAYHHRSFIDLALSVQTEFTGLADDYQGMLDRFHRQVAVILETIAAAPGEGVVFHCAAGKDRTGIIAALLLELVGVPRSIIGEDYALSAQLLLPRTQAWLDEATSPTERVERETWAEARLPRPEVMTRVLAFLDREYGGTEAYLRQAGVGQAAITRLRERLASS